MAAVGQMVLCADNCRTLSDVQLPLGDLTVVVGGNGAGKSTLALIAAAVLCRSSRLGLSARQRASLVGGRSDTAVASLFASGGSVRIVWPEGQMELSGEPPEASGIATGLVRPARLPPAERAAALTAALGGEPDQQEWIGACRFLGIEDDAAVAGAWAMIRRHGWDAAAVQLRDQARERKGAWQQLTGHPWGRRAAERYLGPEDGAARQHELDGLAQELAQATAERDEILKAGAVDAHERVRLQVLAEALDSRRDALTAAETAFTAHAQVADEWREKLRAVALAKTSGRCPHCSKPVELWPDTPDPVRKPTRAATVDKQTADRWRETANEAIRAVKAVHAHAADLRVRMQEAEHAAALLAKDAPPDSGRLEQVEERLAALETAMAEHRTKAEAWRLHRELDTLLRLADLADPTGARQAKLGDRLGALNDSLGELCGRAGCPLVTVQPDDLVIAYGDAAAEALAQSEQWLVDALLALAVARADGSVLCILDGLDVLDTRNRNGVLAAVRASGVPTLLLLTAPAVAAERLQAAGVPTWRLVDGRLAEVGKRQEAA
jgi:energy-coupling factor transporter ATP-binding protein EcfA2